MGTEGHCRCQATLHCRLDKPRAAPQAAVTVELKVKLGSIPDSAIGISLLAQLRHTH
jgi:hypothetical protein